MDAGFTKRRSGPEARDFFVTEAAGLDWLRTSGAPPVPRVLALGHHSITIQRVPAGRPDASAAEELGRSLATLHSSGAPAFGSPPPGAPRSHGWIGDLTMPYAQRETFTQLWAEDRVRATAVLAARRGSLSSEQLRVVDRFADDLLAGSVDVGPPEPPARLHGDLWSGNVVWAADGLAWLIDPAAHGGHRESDLAMLALFGAPELDRILAAYDEVAPLAAGWRARVPLHQVWPLLVHTALFGGGYAAQAMSAIRSARRA